HLERPSTSLSDAALPPLFHFKPPVASVRPLPPREVSIVNGRFVAAAATLWGGAINDGWWRGQANPANSVDAGGMAITRFVPGRTGPGLTEDLTALARKMAADGTPFYQNIPGLWY